MKTVGRFVGGIVGDFVGGFVGGFVGDLVGFVGGFVGDLVGYFQACPPCWPLASSPFCSMASLQWRLSLSVKLGLSHSTTLPLSYAITTTPLSSVSTNAQADAASTWRSRGLDNARGSRSPSSSDCLVTPIVRFGFEIGWSMSMLLGYRAQILLLAYECGEV